MRETRRVFLAYDRGDYDGLRRRLDALARKGWELQGRAGLFSGELHPTKRRELRYDVVPVLPGRTAEELEETVRRRRDAGWEPVDTVWGMDIYKSLPCREPAPMRDDAVRSEICRVFRFRLVQALGCLLLTSALLWLNRERLSCSALTYRWYLSDTKTAALILLPIAAAAGVWLLAWMVFCLLTRAKDHNPPGTAAMTLRAGIRLAGGGALALLAVALWVDAIPRLWLRLALAALFVLLLPLSALVGRRGRQAWLLTAGGGLLLLLALTMVLSWTVKPAAYELTASILPEECLTTTPQGRCSGWYSERESLLVRQYDCYQRWEDGTQAEITLYRCLNASLAKTVAADTPAGAGDRLLRFGAAVCLATGELDLTKERVEAILARFDAMD